MDECDLPLLGLWRVLWPSLLIVALACHFDYSCSMRDGTRCTAMGAGEVFGFEKDMRCSIKTSNNDSRRPRRESLGARLVQGGKLAVGGPWTGPTGTPL